MHVVYLLFMLHSRMTAYFMCSVLHFSSWAWVDIGPLQHLRWSTFSISTAGSHYYC